MDNLKIHDSQLSHRKQPFSLAEFIDNKIQNSSTSTEGGSESCRTVMPLQRKIMPKYSFKFGKHFVGDFVQYEIELVESFKVFRKTITQKYKFKTRYSKLQKLHKKIGGANFPQKKLFGNKSERFIESRKKQLQIYVNGLCDSRQSEFLCFISQIKQSHFNLQDESAFKLPQ